jgi:UDP-N-acetylglucosamine--N-acetylmuramyl-(pentapeptide) pyrophosphoryl-undecaprenol N-acetylglucosamine transferase
MMLDNRLTRAQNGPGGCLRAFAAGVSLDPRTRTHAPPSAPKTHGSPISLVIAGGSTGGHLFPGIAIAQEVMANNTSSHVRFIGTGNRFETDVLHDKGFEQQRIRVSSLKGKTRYQQIKALATLPVSILRAVWILMKSRPDVVLGVGGYSAGPVVMAAWMLGIPRALHEQNVIPGMTNRMLSYFTDRIYVSFENTRIKAPEQKIHMTGNPVRKEILSSMETAGKVSRGPVSADAPFTVFIVGGSQGAHRINTAVMEALVHIRSRDRVAFIHQTGAADEDMVRKAYDQHHITSRVKPFFHHMETEYCQADLVICRAGASTIAELAVLGKGVIFVPYPFAADDHQAVNARELVSAGAAEMILEKDLNGKVLAQKIETHAHAPQKRINMGANMRKQARPLAAREIVADLYDLVNKAI